MRRYPVDGGAEDVSQRVTLTYDGTTGNSKGRLKDAQYGFGWTESFTYTNAGLPLTKSLTWPSTGAGVLTLTAEYDNEGRRTSLRYPTHYTKPGATYVSNLGRKLLYGFDAAGRLSSVNQETGGALISAINYNAAFQVTSWTRSWEGSTSASETFDFNEAGQLTRQKLLNPSALVDVEYRYSAANDGRLWQRKNWVSGEEVTYQYDSLGRLSSAATTSTAWGLSWSFDGFGNRLQQAVTKGSAPVHSAAVDGLTNRIIGQSYDANGNMMLTGVTYDVDNRMASDGVYGYGYSSANQRIRVTSATDTFAWFYGFEGEMIAVYKLEKENGDAGKTWPVLQTARERVYALGRLIRMGTNDVVVDRGASVIRHGATNLAYYPYGEEQGGASANDRAKFATYTRDASTGLDYAWNRMYKTEWGRFTSADPWKDSSRMTRPAGWNRFAYVGGDPVNLYDPSGLESTSVPGGPASVPVGWKPDIIINKDEYLGGPESVMPIPSVFAGALGGEQPGPVYEVDIGDRYTDPGGLGDWDPYAEVFRDCVRRLKSAIDAARDDFLRQQERFVGEKVAQSVATAIGQELKKGPRGSWQDALARVIALAAIVAIQRSVLELEVAVREYDEKTYLPAIANANEDCYRYAYEGRPLP